MFIFGFPVPDEQSWDEDPFEVGNHTPEEDICEVCHIYHGADGERYIGIDMSLGLTLQDMRDILSPFSKDLDIRKVKT